MNILFLTLVEINTLDERGIYQDLLRKFKEEGSNITIVTPVERRKKIKTNISQVNGVTILKVKTYNIQKTHIIEKGLGTLAIEHQYLKAIKYHLNNIKFDIILYSTPPITLVNVIKYVKKRDNAFTYLLLKDIFPQNAVDMKMIKNNSLLHRFFIAKEKKLYAISDQIGCMSPANVNFILKHNAELNVSKVEVNPNSITPIYNQYSEKEKVAIRNKYGLPVDSKILIYGGNLGKPQGLNFLLETIQNCTMQNVYFLIIGNGTEFNRIFEWFSQKKPTNAKLMKSLPKLDFDKLVASCDIGLIFLHPDFTIPNFPSRLLSYLETAIPVIAATDAVTDIGRIIEKNECGASVLSGDSIGMIEAIQRMILGDSNKYKEACKNLLEKEFLTERSYQIILNKYKSVQKPT